jgi:stage III sporulation protein AB
MLKAAGMLLILFSGAGLGLSFGWEMRERERLLEEILSMISYIKEEIRFANVPLPEAFLRAGGRLPGVCGEFLIDVAGRMAQEHKLPFANLFAECALEYFIKTPLSEKEREALTGLGSSLGHLDRVGQIGELERREAVFGGFLSAVKEELPVKERLYRNLGLLGGIVLVVLIW